MGDFQFDAPSCNQDPQKTKGAISSSCSVARCLRGNTKRGICAMPCNPRAIPCNLMRPRAIPCKLMRPCAIKCDQNPQKNFLPLFKICLFSTWVGVYPTVQELVNALISTEMTTGSLLATFTFSHRQLYKNSHRTVTPCCVCPA
jgi:hypothetical protein